MNPTVLNRYLRLIEPLSIDLKLELISGITESLKKSGEKSNKKQELFLELKGSWEEVPDDLEKEIYALRTVSDREIKFD